MQLKGIQDKYFGSTKITSTVSAPNSTFFVTTNNLGEKNNLCYKQYFVNNCEIYKCQILKTVKTEITRVTMFCPHIITEDSTDIVIYNNCISYFPQDIYSSIIRKATEDVSLHV